MNRRSWLFGVAAYRRALIERGLVERVQKARKAGASWTRIGNELGTSGEAARQRYGSVAQGVATIREPEPRRVGDRA